MKKIYLRENWHLAGKGRCLRYRRPVAALGARRGEPCGVRPDLCADGYVHAVEPEGACVFGDNYFSLLPGETKTVTVRPAESGADFTVKGYTLCTEE